MTKPLQWICTVCRFNNSFRLNMHGKTGNDIFKCQGKNCSQPVSLSQIRNVLSTQLRDSIMQYYSGTYKCDSCDYKSQMISMKAKPICQENDCGTLNPGVSDKMINGILSNWLQLFESEKLRKQSAVDDNVLQTLKVLESVVSEVKKKSNFENLNTAKLYEKIQPLYEQRTFKHYLF